MARKKKSSAAIGATFQEYLYETLRDPDFAGEMLKAVLVPDKKMDSREQHFRMLRQFLHDLWNVHGPRGPGMKRRRKIKKKGLK